MKPATDASILAAALIVSLVPLSPARVLADELPKDTNQIERLTPEQATALAGSTAGWVRLPNLTALDAATAKALAEFKGQDLSLNGLTTLDADTAKALAEFKGPYLELSGLTTLDAGIAKALAEFKGSWLRLNGLTTLDADLAKTLAALIEKEDVEIPLIETLELIQEPDGSPMEDFIIPKGFETRQKRRQQGR